MTTKITALLGALTLLITITWTGAAYAQCDKAKLCYKDSLSNGAGKPLKWPTTSPIKYKINVSLFDTAKQQLVIDAVKAAFKAFELPCTDLKFTYAGASTSFSDEKGVILVYWGNNNKDKSSWIYGNLAYHREMTFNSIQTGEITGGSIAMNSGDYGWLAGGKEVAPPPTKLKGSYIDAKTAVMWMLPDVIGFWVANDFSKQDLPIAYNTTLAAPCALHKTGAQYTYFNSGTGCTQPAKPAYCKGGPKAPDGAIPDGFFYDQGAKLDKGGSKLDGGGGQQDTGGSGKSCTKSEECPSGEVCTVEGKCVKAGGDDEDEGCCSVGHASRRGLPLLSLLLAALLLRRRRG